MSGVSLSKGQGVSLSKTPGGNGLTRVTMGLGWDPASTGKKSGGLLGGLFGGGGEGGGEIDLDASVGLFDASGQEIDLIYYGHKNSRCGSIFHTGDNLTGEGDGDDEQIKVDLSRIPSNVQTLVFVITSFSGQKFNQVENAFCRMVNESNDQEIVRYNLTEQPANTAMVMMTLKRQGNDWEVKAIGNPTNGKTPQNIISDMRAVA